MASYEEVLHLIRYRNWHTVSLFDRKFKLVCSELNGRYVSNEFKVEVRELICSLRTFRARWLRGWRLLPQPIDNPSIICPVNKF